MMSPNRIMDVISVENAIITDILAESTTEGYVTITFETLDNAGMIYDYTVRLVVSEDTIVQDQFAERLSLQDLSIGMRVSALFSAAMTRSIPPQSQAFMITLKPEEEDVAVTVDRVASVDLRNGFLYTGNPYDISDQMRFVISNATAILDREGNRISLGSISPGQMVRVEHANFQTASIPPQTTAFLVQVC